MKFIHIADCHLGGWRDPKMKQLNFDSFKYSIDYAKKEQADFILIAGDLFNTSIPPLDILKDATSVIKSFDKPIYIIAGSHDFSPSGKTMIDVLENAGLVINVVRGEIKDEKLFLKFTNAEEAKITGMLGKKGMLDKKYYEKLDYESLENEPGFKIFMFHTSLDELKPSDLEKMEAMPVSLLPKGFNYYAGGHVHIRARFNNETHKNVIYPGPTYPNNFAELEKLGSGSFIEYNNGEIIEKKIPSKEVLSIVLNCKDKSPEAIHQLLLEKIEENDFQDKIVLIRLKGKLLSGNISDIRLYEIVNLITSKGAYIVMRNTSGLKTVELSEIKISMKEKDEIERDVIKEHVGKIKIGLTPKEEIDLTEKLILTMADEKQEGEKKDSFEKRLSDNADILAKFK